MTHFFTWRVTPMLHGGALTVGMEMVKRWRHISRICGYYLSIYGAYFIEFVPFYGGFHIVKHHLIVLFDLVSDLCVWQILLFYFLAKFWGIKSGEELRASSINIGTPLTHFVVNCWRLLLELFNRRSLLGAFLVSILGTLSFLVILLAVFFKDYCDHSRFYIN